MLCSVKGLVKRSVKRPLTDNPNNPNNTDLTFSPKNHLPQVGQMRIFSISIKTHKTDRKL